ncbi:hypothetical protein PMZ80_005803 [Knufia obscura]|uniref:Uncharacterized protein n=1 Tax=Knufia obscura TaxID=1635080 RepID=A0ABR0RML5_9EURO|nr:hypothetical protein PMZ80_005803 [Knufia obscura]
MAQGRKRKAETVDLTADSDTENTPNRKLQKQSASSAYATPPSSSQPLRNSQGRAPSFNNSQSYGSFSSSQTPSQAERDAWLAIPASSAAQPQLSPNEWSLTQQRSVEDDISRSIDLTQDDDDEDAYENRQLYGILNTSIVGIRYYDGSATIGEYVMVRREPGNPYDRNAIRIDNVRRQQIGHIGRDMAAKLAPFMDSGDLLVEGALTGVKGDFKCPIGLKLFGTASNPEKWALRSRMIEVKLPVQELNKAESARQRKQKELEKQQAAREKAASKMRKQGNVVYDNVGPSRYSNLGSDGDGTTASQDIGTLLSNTATFNPRDVQNAVSRLAHGEDDLAKMKLTDHPEQLATQLLPYQSQGLRWMLDQESPRLPDKENNDSVQFWKKHKGGYLNVVTNFLVRGAPELASGGILADDMGVGKTIQVISLIMADPKKTGQPTLIIAPLSVMSNWKNQAEMHVKKKYAPNVLIYHGQGKRGLSPEQFKKYNIVVTTYQTMTLELFTNNKDKPCQVPTSKGLFSVQWRRVVLDEGHNIRNPKAKMSRAAHTLMADSRWVLSGTPIVNSLKDLYSHVKFLRLSGGLSEFEIFNANIIRPVKNQDSAGQMLLRALMQTLCLRRMKDMKFVNLKLPDLTYHSKSVKFLTHEQEKYDAFRAEAKGLVEAAKAQKGENTMTHLLEVLLRLRQTCNHWKMCGEERMSKLMSLIEENSGKTIDIIDPANKKALQDLLQLKLDNQEDCPICMESLTERDRNPVITACAHAFCKDCIERVVQTQQKCPMCRADLPTTDLLIQPAANFGEGKEEQDLDIDPNESSSKIEAILDVLRATKPDTKTVVFSQWTSFLDILEPHLHKHNLHFTRLDGRLSPLERDVAMETLRTDPECRILLASLSACSVGVNLTAASQVILADSWWAPAVEDQAVDRVYRLGQTRECRVVRFVMEGSVEEEVLEVQKTKRQLVNVAFGEAEAKRKRGEEARRERLGEIERLLR